MAQSSVTAAAPAEGSDAAVLALGQREHAAIPPAPEPARPWPVYWRVGADSASPVADGLGADVDKAIGAEDMDILAVCFTVVKTRHHSGVAITLYDRDQMVQDAEELEVQLLPELGTAPPQPDTG